MTMQSLTGQLCGRCAGLVRALCGRCADATCLNRGFNRRVFCYLHANCADRTWLSLASLLSLCTALLQGRPSPTGCLQLVRCPLSPLLEQGYCLSSARGRQQTSGQVESKLWEMATPAISHIQFVFHLSRPPAMFSFRSKPRSHS